MPTQYRPNQAVELPTVAKTLLASPSFATYSRLLAGSGLEEILRGPGPFTVFAPTEEAFRDLPPGRLDELVADPERLRAALAHHVVKASLDGASFSQTTLKTLQGTTLDARVTDDGLTVDHAQTCRKAIKCANGLIQPIDAVLVPGFVRAPAPGASAESAWTGKRAPRPHSTPDPEWPFIEPKSAGYSAD